MRSHAEGRRADVDNDLGRAAGGGGYLIGATGSHLARLHLTDLPDLPC